MRRALGITITAGLLFTACGGDDGASGDEAICDRWAEHRDAVIDGERNRQEQVDDVTEMVDMLDEDVSLQLQMSVEILAEVYTEGRSSDDAFQSMEAACTPA